MLICDTHADTLYAMAHGKSADALDVTKERLLCAPDARLQVLALFVGVNGLRGEDADLISQMLKAFEKLKAQGFVQVTEPGEAKAGVANAMLSIEGGEAFGDDPDSVARFAALGVRLAAPVWNNENALAHPAVGGSTEGLKPFGRDVVRKMRENHMAVDLSHLNECGTWEVLDSDTPPMASHSCANALCRHPRNLSDEQLRAIFAAKGFVGVNFYAEFLSEDGRADLDSVIDHMAHMCELGGENAVGLGSDFDGIDAYPEGLRRADDLYALFSRMKERGFGDPLIKRVAGLNFQQYMARI